MKKVIFICIILLLSICIASAQVYNTLATQIKGSNNDVRVNNNIYSSTSFTVNKKLLQLESSNFYSDSVDLFKKSRNQSKAAFIMLGGGGALLLTGIITSIVKAGREFVGLFDPNEEVKNYTVETLLLVVGGAAVIGSIPLFVAASQNKHKAKLLISNQKTSYIMPPNVGKNITGITLQISIGK